MTHSENENDHFDLDHFDHVGKSVYKRIERGANHSSTCAVCRLLKWAVLCFSISTGAAEFGEITPFLALMQVGD